MIVCEPTEDAFTLMRCALPFGLTRNEAIHECAGGYESYSGFQVRLVSTFEVYCLFSNIQELPPPPLPPHHLKPVIEALLTVVFNSGKLELCSHVQRERGEFGLMGCRKHFEKIIFEKCCNRLQCLVVVTTTNVFIVVFMDKQHSWFGKDHDFGLTEKCTSENSQCLLISN